MKRVLALILVLLLVMTAFVACKKKKTDDPKGTTKPVETTVGTDDTGAGDDTGDDTTADPNAETGINHDMVEGIEAEDQYDGNSWETPILPAN